MQVEPQAVALASRIMHHYEGCERRRPDGLIEPYLDAKGIPTIGWGNTRWQDGRAVRMDDEPITRAAADSLYEHFLGVFARGVCDLLPDGTAPHETAAFIALAYNIGLSNDGFAGSTALREFRRGEKQRAGDGIEMWNRSGGQVLKGLRRRRRAERMVFDGVDVDTALTQAEAAFP
jgi:lysozyme